VTESQLQILANSAIKQNDPKQVVAALEKLVAAYPKPDYWATLIRRVAAQPGFSSSLAIDVGRLRLAVGVLTNPDDVMDLAQQALQAGLPAEAKLILEKVSGGDAERFRHLRDMAERQTAEDMKTLPASVKEAEAQKTGQGLVVTGLESVFLGQTEQGLAAMERGIAKGGLKSPDEARLHLGEAYAFAGLAVKAAEAFRKIEGAGIAADLARLWLISLDRPASSSR